MICEQGDVVSLNFDPSLAHEPAGRHFAIVISPWQVNTMSALTLVVPVTSHDNGYPLHVEIAGGNPIYGFVQCEAIRSIDLDTHMSAGKASVIGKVDDFTLSRVLGRIRVICGLD